MDLSRYYLSQRACPHYLKNLVILLSSSKVAQKLSNVHELPHRDPSTGSGSSISLSLALRQKSLPTSSWWGARLSPSRHASPQPLLPCPGHRPSLAGLYKKTCRVLRSYFQLINYEVGVPATSTHCRKKTEVCCSEAGSQRQKAMMGYRYWEEMSNKEEQALSFGCS